MRNFNQNRNFGRRGFGRSEERGSGRFGRRDSGRFDRRDSSRSRGSEDRTMHEAVCGKCGNECEVPFEPTEGKPVYCSDCFKKRGSSESSESRKPSRDEFNQLNTKLDRILKILEAPKKEQPEKKKGGKKQKEETP